MNYSELSFKKRKNGVIEILLQEDRKFIESGRADPAMAEMG